MAVADAETRLDRGGLRCLRAADAGVDHLVGDKGGEVGAVVLSDQVEHEIGGSGATGGSRDTVEREGTFDDFHAWVQFAEGIADVPVNGAGLVLDHARRRQNAGRTADADDLDTMRLEPADLSHQRGADAVLWRAAAHDHERLACSQGGKSAIDGDLDAVRGLNVGAILRAGFPAVELAFARMVGKPERLDGAGEGEMRELVEEQEDEMAAVADRLLAQVRRSAIHQAGLVR